MLWRVHSSYQLLAKTDQSFIAKTNIFAKFKKSPESWSVARSTLIATAYKVATMGTVFLVSLPDDESFWRTFELWIEC